MKSVRRGDVTSGAEVTGISPHGVWLLVDERELFLPFEDFPWFRDAPVGGVLHVERPQPHHLYWPELDVDLSVDSIESPKRFPLLSRERPKRPAARPVKSLRVERKTASRRNPAR